MILKKVRIDLKRMNSTVDSLVYGVRGAMKISDESEYKIRLVSKELLTNVISYSDADDIKLYASLDNGKLTIVIEDNGSGFDYSEVMRRDVTGDSFLMSEGGRGIFLVRMMADEMRYNEKGNRVTVRIALR